MAPREIENIVAGWDSKRLMKAALWVVGAIIALIMVFNTFVIADASEIVVVQSITGTLTSNITAGPKFLFFGKATRYKKRDQFSFSAKKDQGKKEDESLPVMFNDGGSAKISGVISWEMPLSTEKILKLHNLYGSQHAVEQQLIRPAVERAIYLTGPLMSSAEAYSARKPDLLKFFEDQTRNGVYQMETNSEKQKDPITGIEKTVQIVRVALDSAGLPKRQSSSQVTEFGIVLLSPAIDSVEFEPTVKKQIADQQANFMAIQTAKSKALQAEQDAITAQKNGEAAATKAKWLQEVDKATEVTMAEKNRDVAALNVKTAELVKQKLVLEGQGEAEKRRLAMQADGALEKKLASYVEVQKAWADAFARHQQPLVPSMQFGGGQTGGNGATQLLELLTAKTARDLSLDLSNAGAAKRGKEK